jgi:hypothetical protein
MPFYRRLGNAGFVALSNVLFGSRFTDITYGYNAVWRRHADALALEIDGWANEIISNIRATRAELQVVEVPSFEHRRIAGEAKLGTISAGLEILMAILAERLRPTPAQSAQRLASGTRAAVASLVQPVLPRPAPGVASNATQPTWPDGGRS